MRIATLTLCSLLAAIPARSSESASDCAAAVDTLRAGIAGDPANAVVYFEDAIQANPSCVASLVSAAIEATGADEALLRGFIGSAIAEYPSKTTEIAGAAMEAAPHAGEVIRDAFFSDGAGGGGRAAPKPAPVKSPIERFLESQEKEPAPAPKPGERVLAAISEIDEKIAVETSVIEAEPLMRKRDRIEVSEISREIDEETLRDAMPLDETEEEFFGETGITFRDSAGDGTTGHLAGSPGEAGEELPASPLPVPSGDHSPSGRDEADGENDGVDRDKAGEIVEGVAKPPRPFPSSMLSAYFIPPEGSEGAENRQNAVAFPIVLRSVPVSPTQPR